MFIPMTASGIRRRHASESARRIAVTLAVGLLLTPGYSYAEEDCDCPTRVRSVGVARVEDEKRLVTPSGFVAVVGETDPHSGLPMRIRHAATGYELALVAEGLYLVGASGAGEAPATLAQRVVRIPTLWIGVREVTRREYLGNARSVAQASAAMTGVTWTAARAWSRRFGMRLPSEVEWEVAARGPHALPFPWGESWDPVARRRDDRSGFGILQMASEPAEWCEDRFGPDGAARVVRGDFVTIAAREIGLATRRGVSPADRRAAIGFRAVLVPRLLAPDSGER